ncbi:unnamed protein product [Calicophoron daubneyi]|uniref:EF-hand domain-containing protein n=1 Tax=Calicophoron daubneyi TaxID=300641 RepID=A0AAV2T819_CALDB
MKGPRRLNSSKEDLFRPKWTPQDDRLLKKEFASETDFRHITHSAEHQAQEVAKAIGRIDSDSSSKVTNAKATSKSVDSRTKSHRTEAAVSWSDSGDSPNGSKKAPKHTAEEASQRNAKPETINVEQEKDKKVHFQIHKFNSRLKSQNAIRAVVRKKSMEEDYLENLKDEELGEVVKVQAPSFEEKKMKHPGTLGLFDLEGTESVTLETALIPAIRGRLTGIFTEEQVSEFTELTNYDNHGKLNEAEFTSLVGLAERMYAIQNIKLSHPRLWSLLPCPLEKVDFHNIQQRLRLVEVSPELLKLLYKIQELSEIDYDQFFRETDILLH